MSDFFNDDFTAELKAYFLSQFHDEVVKYLEASDEDSWPVFRDEISEKFAEWIVDAKTNEFVFFSAWLENLVPLLAACEDLNFFLSCLGQLSLYLQELAQSKKDSEASAAQFNLSALSNRARHYLHCRIDKYDLVLPVAFIIEVTGDKKISPLPQPLSGLSGMMAYRGEAVPVFAFPELTADHKNFSYIICEVERQLFALQVTHVDQLFEIKEQDLQEKNASGNVFNRDCITHFISRDNKNMMVFDLQRLVAA